MKDPYGQREKQLIDSQTGQTPAPSGGGPASAAAGSGSGTIWLVFGFGVFFSVVAPLLLAGLIILTRPPGGSTGDSFETLLRLLMIASALLGVAILSMAGFMRLVMGRRADRNIGLNPALRPRPTRWKSWRCRRIDLRRFWLPPALCLFVWSGLGGLLVRLAPSLTEPGLWMAGGALFASLYFWSLGWLRLRAVGLLPPRGFSVWPILACGAFLLPLLVADPTRFPNLPPRPGFVLLQQQRAPILPRP